MTGQKIPEIEKFVDANGVWRQVFDPALADRWRGRAALFLDRDGVIVEEVNYLCNPNDVRLIDGAIETIRTANEQGIAVIVITNQAGIAYGRFDWAEFAAVQGRMISDLAAGGARLDAVYACPHHKTGRQPYRHPDHPSRKPNPGMLISAQADLALDLSKSWIVGDKASDLDAGRRAGLGGGVHVFTGHGRDNGERETAESLATPSFHVRTEVSISGVGAHLHLWAE